MACIDVKLMQNVIHFMRDFADKCHHAKEEAAPFPVTDGNRYTRTQRRNPPMWSIEEYYEYEAKGDSFRTGCREA